MSPGGGVASSGAAFPAGLREPRRRPHNCTPRTNVKQKSHKKNQYGRNRNQTDCLNQYGMCSPGKSGGLSFSFTRIRWLVPVFSWVTNQKSNHPSNICESEHIAPGTTPGVWHDHLCLRQVILVIRSLTTDCFNSLSDIYKETRRQAGHRLAACKDRRQSLGTDF